MWRHIVNLIVMPGKAKLNQVFRLDRLQNQEIIEDRVEALLHFSEGKEVLHVGCCGPEMMEKQDAHVHRKLKEVAHNLYGLDIDKECIKVLSESGDTVFYGDAETFDLEKKDFDVICCGDIIEHLSNPGQFLDHAYTHLKDDGILLLTTPNPFSLGQMLEISVFNRLHINNSEHVCWYDPILLSYLLERSKFQVLKIFWSETKSKFLPLQWFIRNKPFLSRRFGIVAQKIF